jgi:membrane protease YdiL (CAAX protease family)
MKSKTEAIKEVRIFFALTLGLSWLVFWGPIVLFRIPTANVGNGVEGPAWAMPLLALGGAMPTLVGAALIWWKEGAEGLRALLRRWTDFRIGWAWYLAMILVVSVEAAAQVLIIRALGGDFDASLFLTQLGILIPLFFAGPLMEELGWRGYALDRLQTRWNALISGLILGAIWSLWHLPTFYMVGAIQYEWDLSFGAFVAKVTAISVVYVWLHNNTRGSVWTASFFHWIGSYTVSILAMNVSRSPAYNWLEPVPFLLIAAFIVAVWGPDRLTRRAVSEANLTVAHPVSERVSRHSDV